MGYNKLPRIDADSWKETPEDIYFTIEKWGYSSQLCLD